MAADPTPERPAPAPRRPRSAARRLAAGVALLLAAAALAAGGLIAWGHHEYTRPGPLADGKILVVEKGASVTEIARRLAGENVIERPLLFRLALRLRGDQGALKAGEYRFSPGISMRRVQDMMVRGDVVLRRLTVAEGLTAREIFGLVRAAEGLEGEITLEPEEGRFLPETYYYARGDSRDAVLRRMREAMTRTLDELWAARAPDLPIESKEEALILASIIEKETSVQAERKLVASVLVNRLRKGMRLQVDPTVIYGITEGKGPLGRPLLRSELDKETAYNTYLIDGLPPGPIANPGRDAIAAALDPAKTDYLYFVADGSGGHAFARTQREHATNVQKWRAIQRQRAAEEGGD